MAGAEHRDRRLFASFHQYFYISILQDDSENCQEKQDVSKYVCTICTANTQTIRKGQVVDGLRGLDQYGYSVNSVGSQVL